jgi:phytoene dehydrogenase-like protein
MLDEAAPAKPEAPPPAAPAPAPAAEDLGPVLLDLPKSVEVAIVGGGVAGLVCARALLAAGRDAHVFEAGTSLGGRVRTETHREGFRLDLGFHVLLTGYPSVRRELDLPALDVRPYDAGCVVSHRGRLYPLSDPYRGGSWGEAIRFPLASLGDKLKLRGLRGRLAGASDEAIARGASIARAPDRPAREHLRSLGFSRRVIDSFFAPFFGGVFLDRSLSVSSRYFESVFRALLAGPAGTPARGIGAISDQLAAAVPAESVHLGCAVSALELEGDAVVGIRIGDQMVRAGAVVLASTASEVARLAELPIPVLQEKGATIVYYTAPEPPTVEKRIFVRADPEGWTNHFAVLTNVAPELAPPGHHLLAGVILGVPDTHDGAISEYIRSEMAWWFPHGLTHNWRWLRTVKLPAAQWALPPGLAGQLPGTRTKIRGLYLAGDFTREPSLDAALASGRAAAEAALDGRS